MIKLSFYFLFVLFSVLFIFSMSCNGEDLNHPLAITNFNTVGKELIFTTTSIIAGKPSLKTDEFNLRTGTGFFILFNNKIFLVTNKHVIDDAQNLLNEAIKEKQENKFTLELPIHKSDNNLPIFTEHIYVNIKNTIINNKWVFPDNPKIDVAVINFSPIYEQLEKEGNKIFIKAISHNSIPSKESLEDIDAIEQVIFVGYPKSIYDEFNLLPVVRTGLTATPIAINFNNQPIFLVDASVFHGSSGSPVFIYRKGLVYSPKYKSISTPEPYVYFLGIITGAHRSVQKENIDELHKDSVQYYDLGIVYKANCIIETIEKALKIINKPDR